jgi:hypothetical protein
MAKVVEKVLKPVHQPVEKVVVDYTSVRGSTVRVIAGADASSDGKDCRAVYQDHLGLICKWRKEDGDFENNCEMWFNRPAAEALVLALVEFYGLPYRREG